jgi:hypothetical protein
MVLPNWYVDEGPTYNGTFDEVGPGATATVTASIEYPAGTLTQVKFSGQSSGTIANGGQLISDIFTIPGGIPAGATFWERTYVTNPDGLPLRNNRSYGAVGDVGIGGTSGVADQTMIPTMTGIGADPQTTYGAVAIIGPTSSRAFCLIGDSRTYGIYDTMDSTGDLGTSARSIGPNYAYSNMGIPSDRARYFNSYHTIRGALINSYCTDVIDAYGINDLSSLTSATGLEGLLTTQWSYFPSKRIYQLTLDPETSSTDDWETLANQSPTVGGNYNQLVPFNTWVMTKPSPLTNSFDINSIVSYPGQPLYWNVNDTPFWYTPDGIHETRTANLAIQASGIINVSLGGNFP